MRRLLILGLCVTVLGLAAASAQASALSLLFPYSVNILEDDDWESILVGDTFGDGDQFLEEGEVLVGMIVVQKVKQAELSGETIPSPPTENFTAVFALRVSDVTLDSLGIAATYTFEALAKDEWDTLKDLTGQNLGLTDPVNEGTVGQVFSDSSDPYIDENASDSMADAIMTASEGDLLWEIGFRGEDDEFWMANSLAFDGTTFFDPTDITKISTLETRLAINVLHYADDSVLLLQHNFLWDGVVDTINPAGIDSTADIHGFGGLSSEPIGRFSLSTDTDFYIVLTPEPGSLALLGLGLAAVGGVIVRRRRRS